MKRWNPGIEYIYYVPALDELYTAIVLETKPRMKTLRRSTWLIDKINASEVYLNPDVLLLLNWSDGKCIKHETVFVGVV